MQGEPGSQNTIPDPRAQSAPPQTPPWPYAPSADAPTRTQPPLIPYSAAAGGPLTSPRRRSIPRYVWLVGGCLGVLAIGTLAIAVVLGLAAGMALHVANSNLSPARTSDLTKTFPVSGTPTITVTDPAGNVSIQPGSGSTVSMRATIYSSNDIASQGAAAGVSVTSTQHGNAIDITVNISQDNSIFGGNRHVDLALSIPRQATIRATLAAGNITLDHISGVLTTSVAAGNIAVVDGTLADGSHVETDVGNITYAGTLAPGADVTFAAHTGTVTLTFPASTSAHVDAATAVGTISVLGWGLSPDTVAVTGRTLVGSLGSSPNCSVHVRVDTGNITIRQG